MSKTKKEDLLAAPAEAEIRKNCRHPNLGFGRYGYQLQCVDCERRWIAAAEGFELPDYTYAHPALDTGEFRHSPNEAPRREPAKKIR